jgi:hypothetical protein
VEDTAQGHLLAMEQGNVGESYYQLALYDTIEKGAVF